MRLQPSSLPSPSLHPAVSPSTKMQMNDATEPLKIIIGAAVTTAAAQRKIYFLIFNGVNAYRKTKKRNTKKQKKEASKKAMQMQLSAEQNVFRDEVIKEREEKGAGRHRREALGTEIVISTLPRFRFRTYC